MSLVRWYILAGLLLVLAPVAVIGYLVHWQAQQTLLAEYGMRLDSLAVERRQILNLLIQQQQEALRTVAQTGQLKRLADTLSGRKSDTRSSGEGPASPIPLPMAQLLFRGLLLADPTGTRTLAAGAFEGQPLSLWTEDLAGAGQGVWVRGDAGTERGPYILVGMPAKDGVALAWASLTGIQTMLLDRRALGTNGESFIVDRHGLVMAPELRYPQGHGGNISSNAMGRCLQGESRSLVVEADYTGALTAMAYQSLPEIGGGCLMVHMRADEIFASARALRNRIVALTLSALFVLFPAGLFLGRRVGRHTEALLRQAHDKLEQLVQQRTGELTHTNTALQAEIAERRRTEETLKRTADELQAANKELEAFAYSVAHDLRAPLRSIDGFSQAILEDYTDKLDEEGRDYLRRVRAATQRMAELIDNLLTLSRVTRSEMRLETVQLTTLAREIAEELRRTRPDREATFLIAQGLIAKGDPVLLHQVMQNLIDNAWKFTSSHPSARIEFGMADHDGRPAYFVRDDGVGFDMAYADKLFTPFQRLHSEAEFPGTGIGLATVQRIVRRHGGRAWAEGAVDRGATVYFTLG